MAVIVVIAIIAILLIYIGGNVRVLHFLSRDLKLVERQQLLRIHQPLPGTNTLSRTNLVLRSEHQRFTAPAGRMASLSPKS